MGGAFLLSERKLWYDYDFNAKVNLVNRIIGWWRRMAVRDAMDALWKF